MTESRRTTFYTSHPGKAVWSMLHLIFGLARLPFWAIYFIPSFTRQDPRYTWRKAFSIRFFRAFLHWASVCEMKAPTPLLPGAEKDQWVALEPAESKYFTGIALVDPEIRPAKTGGTWYAAKPGAGEKVGKVALHFHGGAYVVGDGRKVNTEWCCKNFIKNSSVTHVFSCQYRLASNPGGRFPAALQDAITCYTYLLFEMKINPKDIIVTGDSAGGNLTLCLLRYLADHGQKLNLPNPGCAWLWSPWVDPASSLRDPEVLNKSPNASFDYLTSGFGCWGAELYVPAKSTGLTGESEYINFLAHPFKSETPMFFGFCENEVLFDDDQKAYDAYSAIGNKTGISIEEAAPHDIVLIGDQLGFAKEAGEAVQKADKFLQSVQ